ncbi:MAG: methyltransferase domain-containing protein [Candidatus Omnitrophica bacterium]|nr:methyltransferase domain-containing protein [Candidatus Omnitrophota bacterium]
MLSKEKIKESFSRAATSYDEASGFQKEIGRLLIERVLTDKIPRGVILDVGMGTGVLTQELALALNAQVYGCDLSWGMVLFSKSKTKGLFITQADAEMLPYKKEIFNIIFSNLTYQWIRDLKSAFLEVKRVLKKEGKFYFSILAKGSLNELYKTIGSIKTDFNGGFLPTEEVIKSAFEKADMNLIWWEEKTIKRYYASLLELLMALKGIGAGRMLDENIFGMGQRRLFFQMIETYDKSFNEEGKTFVTYNVILGCVKKL